MNKSELIEHIAKQADISKAAATRALEAVIGGVKTTLKKNNSVSLVGFGTFAALLEEQLSEKISRRILSGDQGMLVWWSIGAGVHVEPHSHANEQIVWMLKGKMEFRRGTEQWVYGPGDVIGINPQLVVRTEPRHGDVAADAAALVQQRRDRDHQRAGRQRPGRHQGQALVDVARGGVGLQHAAAEAQVLDRPDPRDQLARLH